MSPRLSATQRAVLALCRTATTTAQLRVGIRPPGARVLNGSGLQRTLKLLVQRGLLQAVAYATWEATDAGRAELELLNLNAQDRAAARRERDLGRQDALEAAEDPDEHAGRLEREHHEALDAQEAEAERQAAQDELPAGTCLPEDLPPAAAPDPCSCGCCTAGCTCLNHQDVPRGRPPKVCGFHRLALPAALLEHGPRLEALALLEDALRRLEVPKLQEVVRRVQAQGPAAARAVRPPAVKGHTWHELEAERLADLQAAGLEVAPRRELWGVVEHDDGRGGFRAWCHLCGVEAQGTIDGRPTCERHATVGHELPPERPAAHPRDPQAERFGDRDGGL